MSRRPSFMKDELKAITDSLHQRQKLLFSSFNNTDTHLAKERGWQQIVEEVNAVSQVKRSKEEIKRKWTYIKSETKKKNSQHRRSLNKNGGGPVDLSNDPDETERVVLGILGPTAINGISGGIETTDLPYVNERGDTAVFCVHQIAFPEETVTINNNESPKITYMPAKPVSSCSSATATSSIGKRLVTVGKRVDEELLVVEKEKLIIETERLVVEKRRLQVEQDRLYIEKSGLEIETKRFKLEEDRQLSQQNFNLCSPFNSQSGSMMSYLQM